MNYSMEIEKLFALASGRELDARDFYRTVEKKATDPAVQAIFKQLAVDEHNHYEMIERFRTDQTLLLKIPAPSDWKLAEQEELPPFTPGMNARDAIALAMKKEQAAVEFYRALAAATADAGMRSIFENLAHMELGHKHALESAFTGIAYPEVF